jgi:hypothetical protein
MRRPLFRAVRLLLARDWKAVARLLPRQPIAPSKGCAVAVLTKAVTPHRFSVLKSCRFQAASSRSRILEGYSSAFRFEASSLTFTPSRFESAFRSPPR